MDTIAEIKCLDNRKVVNFDTEEEVKDIFGDIEIKDLSNHKVADQISSQTLFDTEEEAKTMGEMLNCAFKVRCEHKKYRLTICTKHTDAEGTPMAIGDKLYNLIWGYKGIIVDIKEFNGGAVVVYYRTPFGKIKNDYLCTHDDCPKSFLVDFELKKFKNTFLHYILEMFQSIWDILPVYKIIIATLVTVVEVAILVLSLKIVGWF